MPNSTSDPHGKVTASATPRSMMSRTSGAEDCTLVPPDAFSTAAPQSSRAFCSGCDAGTQCDSLSSKVFSCAQAGVMAGVTLAASSNAKNAFLIDIFSLGGWSRATRRRSHYLTCYIDRAVFQAGAGSAIAWFTPPGCDAVIFLQCGAVKTIASLQRYLRKLLYDIIIIARPAARAAGLTCLYHVR